MKIYWGRGGTAPCSLNHGIRWRWEVSFTPRPLYPRRKFPGNHWIRGCKGPRADFDVVAKRKNFIITPAGIKSLSSSP